MSATSASGKANLPQREDQCSDPLDFDDEQSRDLTVHEDEATGGSPIQNTRLSPKSNPLIPSKDTKITKSSTASRVLKSKLSWLTQTEFFQNAIDTSFDKIDVDKSGNVTLEELYAGLLLIHLKMAVYVGPPACRPASKSYVSEIFHLLDKDNSGTVQREEFAMVIKILYSQVFTRIVIHWSLTLMIVPVITKYIIKYITLLYWISHESWKDIDDDLDPLQRLMWKLWALFFYLAPQAMDNVKALVWIAFSKVPKEVLKSMPFTLLALAQTSIALPYALNCVEDFFMRAAHGNTERNEERRGKLKDC